MKWIAWVAGGLVALVAGIGLIGLLLPAGHVAAVRVHIRQPPEQVFAVVSNVHGATAWRSDLQQVEMLSAPEAPPRWRETTDFGTLVMTIDEAAPPGRLVTRIDDPGQPFGGRWIYELAPTADGTTLTITEEGEVYNPFFRFLSRFVFGHYGMLETYARDLAGHFGETAQPERVGPDE